jgi:ubiquinone biosynthesis protein
MLFPSVAAAIAVLVLATVWSVSMISRGNQVDGAADPPAVGVFSAGLIITSSLVVTAGTGPRISGLPVYGLFGCIGATIAGTWMLVSLWRGRRRK